MKRLLATLTLIICLSFPILAGHTQASGVWCNCDDPSSHINGQSTTGISDGHEGTLDNVDQSTTPDLELALLLLAMLFLLKPKV
jgi:hypothetical protein